MDSEIASYLQLRIEKETAEDGIRELLQKVKPSSNNDDYEIQKLSGGFSCLMFKCFKKSTPKEAVTVRIFDHIDAAGFTSHEFENVVLREANKQRCCPHLLAFFANGYCYSFVEGEPLMTPTNSVFRVTENMFRTIGKQLADIHRLRVEGFESEKITYFSKLLQALENLYSPTSVQCPSKEAFKKEIIIIEKFAASVNSPRVICHGDSHLGNMIWNEIEGKVTFLDWEFSQVFYRAYDLCYFLHGIPFMARAFNQKAIIPPDYIRLTCKGYLEREFEINGKTALDVGEADVENLLQELEIFKLVVLLFFITANVTLGEILDNAKIDKNENFDHAFSQYMDARERQLGSRSFGE